MSNDLLRFWDEQKDAFIIPYADMMNILKKENLNGYVEGYTQGQNDEQYRANVLDNDWD